MWVLLLETPYSFSDRVGYLVMGWLAVTRVVGNEKDLVGSVVLYNGLRTCRLFPAAHQHMPKWL